MRAQLTLAALSAFAGAAASAQETARRERVEHYGVRGRSAGEILAQMEAKGPSARAGRYFAATRYDVGWTYRFERQDEGCALTSFDIAVDTTYTFPRWEDRARGDARLSAYWDYYLGRVDLHEKGHGAVAAAIGADLAERLSAIGPKKSCDDLEHAMKAAGKAAMRTGDLKQLAYDRDTNHGETQDAWFDLAKARGFRTAAAD